MLFIAHFDDGGHPNDQIAVLVAGFIATEKQWQLFEGEWKRTVDRFNIRAFHMTDFEASKKWSRTEKDNLIGDLVSIIKRRTRYHISHIVPMKDYREINEQRAFEEMMGTPYALAGRTAARSINDWKAKYMKPDDELLVRFEDGTMHKGDFMEAMKRDELPCPLFINKTTALEAADLFAWELLYTLKTNRIRYALHELFKHPGEDGYYEGHNLLDLATKIPVPAPLRATLPKNTALYNRSSPKDRGSERYSERVSVLRLFDSYGRLKDIALTVNLAFPSAHGIQIVQESKCSIQSDGESILVQFGFWAKADPHDRTLIESENC